MKPSSFFYVSGIGSSSKFRRERNKLAKSVSTIPAAIIERTFTLFVHAFTNVLIVLAVQTGNYVLFWYSFSFKSLLDAIAAFGLLKWKVLESLSRLWMLELIVVFFGLVSIVGIWLLRPN